MTIKEFIKELEKCNPEADIYIYNSISEIFYPIKEIIDYCGDTKDYVIESKEDV